MSDSSCTGDSCPVDFSSRTKSTLETSCPVDHSSMSASNVSANTLSLGSSSSNEPSNSTRNKSKSSACPVDHTDRKILNVYMQSTSDYNPDNNMPAVPEQHKSKDQSQTLSTQRIVSSIPRADRYESAGQSECPALELTSNEGSKDRDMWVYPSEQMFFNAMKRKNWDPKEQDMKTVVPIHNAVNEKCWRQILEWEKMHRSECSMPMLLKFEGKAKEITPKARMRMFLGYQPPFDRHDWTVDRCGKPVRYVIDFYQGKTDPRNPMAPSFYLDVRPALTIEGAWDRTRRFFANMF
ncbi:Cytochrome c1 heme lyase [Coemansia asiatica]|nr:Cytochrome c1 heme lyase [Coemansia asiatica]